MSRTADLNDGEIISLEIFKGKAYLTYLNWEREVNKLSFNDIIHVEYLNAGYDTGDFIVIDNDKKILETCNKLDENIEGFKLFRISCPWEEHVLVEIIAKELVPTI